MSFSFSSKPQVLHGTIDGVNYILRQASAGAVTAYRNARQRGAKFAGGKFSGVDGLANAELDLVGQCLYTAEEFDKGRGFGRDGKPVGTEFLASLPNDAQVHFFAWLEKNSSLEEKATVEGVTKQIEVLQEQLRALKGEDASEAKK